MKRPAPTQESPQDLLVEAQERILQSKASPSALKEVQRLKRQYALPDEAELGLRLLTPTTLQKFVYTEEKNLQSRMDLHPLHKRGEVVLHMLSRLDRNVARMVAKLRELDASGTRNASPSAASSKPIGSGPAKSGLRAQATSSAAKLVPGGDAVVQAARTRLDRSKLPSQKLKMENLKKDFDLGDEVLLAMRMLGAKELQEFLAGEDHVRKRLAGEEDRNKLMMWLISQLDPEVEKLVGKLLELDTVAAVGASAPAVGTPVPGPRDHHSAKLAPAAPRKFNLARPEASTAPEKPVKLPEPGSPLWRPLLKQVYSDYNPEKLKTFDSIIAKYKNAEDVLYRALSRKYKFPMGGHKKKTPSPKLAAKPLFAKALKLGASKGVIKNETTKPIGTTSVNSTVSKGRALAVPKSTARPLSAVTKSEAVGGGYDKDVVAEAQRRLLAHKTPTNAIALGRLTYDNKFSDEVVLALRLLPTAKLQELAGRQKQLEQQLAGALDRNQCMMSMLWALDPEVQTMVRELKSLDGQAVGARKPPATPPTKLPAAYPTRGTAAIGLKRTGVVRGIRPRGSVQAVVGS